MLDSLLILGGVGVLVFTSVVFWMALPRGDLMHRFVGTELEPYIGVAFTAGFALSFTMILAGILGQ